MKDPAPTGTSSGLSQAINRGQITKHLPYYANIYVTIQSHGLSAGARPHYTTANEARNGLIEGQQGSVSFIFLFHKPEQGVPLHTKCEHCLGT